MGKIEVYFKNLDYGDRAYYHEFIVWTSDAGTRKFIHGGPNSHLLGSDSGGGSGSSGVAVAKRGVNVPFGAVTVTAGTYDESAKDWAKPGVDPSQVIITGSDQQLQVYWQKMVATGKAINSSNIPYAFGGLNSSSTVTMLLEGAGLPQPKGNGLDGPTPAPCAEMSLLDHHFSADRGYGELTGNVLDRGGKDIKHGLGALWSEFLVGLKPIEKKGQSTLHDLALAAGRPGLGGFAPVAGTVGLPVGPKRKTAAVAGEAGSVTSGRFVTQLGAGGVIAQRGANEESSYRAVVAHARGQAAMVRARREDERVELHMPVNKGALAGMSFAPRQGGGAKDGVPPRPGARDGVGAPGLHRGSSVHNAMAAAEGAAPAHEEAGQRQAVVMQEPAQAAMTSFGFRSALEDYFFQQSRLPPAGGAAFNPLLSPVWAGLKMPG